MIEKLHLENFKTFRQLDLQFRPITVIAGPNSSGKSSIIQALLLLRQTFESNRRRRLSLNGHYLNYSHYQEIVFKKKEDTPVTIYLEYSVPSLPDIITDERLQRCFTSNEIAVIRESTPQFRSTVSVTFGTPDKDKDVCVLALRVTAEYGTLRNRPLMLEVAFEEGRYGGRLSPLLIKQERGNAEDAEENVSLPLTVPFIDVDTWSFFFPRRVNMALEVDDEPAWSTLEYLDLLGLPMLSTELTEKLHYIGPLRSEPKRAYPIQGNRVELDFRGENTLQVLLDEMDHPVAYLHTDAIQQTHLIDAVNKVLTDILELPQTIRAEPFSGVFSQLLLPFFGADHDDQIRQSDKSFSQYVTIADVGFGVSQILPIVVAGLRAKEDEVLVVEQPEAHLHPRVQSNLADFFVLLARLGKHVIVETHSEHLINGFREAMARDLDNRLELHNQLQVVFVSQPGIIGAAAQVTTLIFDEYGYGMEWPPEFLPRSAVESQKLLRLISEKRKHIRSKLS